ncbi:MAG TPA: hypothetical protein VHD31_02300 [Candidatus Paceibacterota bacterium]|nr:hypothetical protein [Candidatus Paceibacterota bacterium]
MNTGRLILAISFALAAGGFLLPFWPMEVVGILLAALTGHWIFAIALGLLLDVAYGVPTGFFHMLFFPFTLLALASVALRRFGLRYFIDASPQDTL